MAKDYSKIKALAQSIIECIGDDEEGKNPSLPKQEQDINDGGQESLSDLAPIGEGETGVPKPKETDEDKKSKKLSMMSSVLASKFKK